MSKEAKYINFKVLMDELKFFEENEDLPSRNDSRYIGNETIKGIEQIELFEFTPSIMFEMAIRNKEVIEIIEKIEHIYKLMTDILVSEKSKIEEKELIDLEIFNFKNLHNFGSIGFELEDEYYKITLLSIDKFIKELEFLIDSKYNDKIENFFNQNNKLKDREIRYCYELSEIMEILQKKLKYEFFIYPYGYLRGTELNFTQKVISRDVFFKKNINDKIKNQIINEMIVEFRKLKPVDVKSVADLFFMYDYNKKRVEQEDTSFINLNIKIALTKHHGIKIKGEKELLSYSECLERYDELKNKEAGFYIVERSIRDKLDIMKKFIDNRLYCYVVFA